MSTSPCCSYKFPTPGSIDHSAEESYFNLDTASAAISALALSPPDEASYFGSAPLPVKVNKCPNSSISSLASDTTFVETSSLTSSHDFSHSTDTLVDDSVPPKRAGLLSLNVHVPKRAQPMSSTQMTFQPLYEHDEEDTKSFSAVDPRFSFNRTLEPLHNGPPALTSATSMPAVKPPFPLKKRVTVDGLKGSNELSFVETIKSEQLKRLNYVPVLENMRGQITGLSPAISYVSLLHMALQLAGCHIESRTNLPSLLVIDIRPFADYVKCHVAGSINVCLPLTLLKRANFSLKRCMNSLPLYEKTILQNYLHHNNQNYANSVTFDAPSGSHGMSPILVYDHSNHSSNLFHMCRKLVDNSCWDASSTPSIYLINEPFLEFAAMHSDLVSAGKLEPVNLTSLHVQPDAAVPPPFTAPSLSVDTSGYLPPRRLVRSRSTPGLPSIAFELDTPVVSNFLLPQNLPVYKFKIRHNEETFDPPKVLEQFSLAEISTADAAALPQWMREVDNTQIKTEFKNLEECEKDRLNNALCYSGTQSHLVTPGGSKEECPRINCGLDYGHKNRYKDIFLYDHSRVKLQVNVHDCDYINASYINPLANLGEYVIEGKLASVPLVDGMKIIATQGPLNETVGDFWKCVINQKSIIVVSLSDEVENGVYKCSAYWKEGVYKSGPNLIEVRQIKEQQQGNFMLRSLLVTVDSQEPHHVLQVHLANWADMSSSVDPQDLLDIVALKHHVLSSIKTVPEYSTVTHCSAGCGRTGVFCAVDSLVSLLDFNHNLCELTGNPVYELVNNLRRQRISMVQTLRQYFLVYDTVMYYAIHGGKGKLQDLDIVEEFISECR